MSFLLKLLVFVLYLKVEVAKMKITIHNEHEFLDERGIQLIKNFFYKHIEYRYLSETDCRRVIIHIFISESKISSPGKMFISLTRFFTPIIRIYRPTMEEYYIKYNWLKPRAVFFLVLLHEVAHIIYAYNHVFFRWEGLKSKKLRYYPPEERWCHNKAMQFVGDYIV